MVTEHNRSILQLLLVLMIWACSYALTRSAVEDIPPVLFGFLRHLVASIVLLAASRIKGKSVKKPGYSMNGPLIVLALTGISLYYICFNWSLVHTPASTGALIQGFIPVGVVVLAAVFLKEPLTVRKIGGIVLSVAGVVLIGFIGQDDHEPDTAGLLGPLLMVASVVLWCIYTVLARKYSGVDALWLITRITVIGTLLFIPALLFEMVHRPVPSPTWSAWGAILFMGIFSSALSYLWYSSALKHISASEAGIMLNLDPLMGALIAVIFLGEPLLPVQIAGAGLVITGVVLNSLKSKDRTGK